jgi:hypothetical protein
VTLVLTLITEKGTSHAASKQPELAKDVLTALENKVQVICSPTRLKGLFEECKSNSKRVQGQW